jgi:endonuclease/exonuclease/phosphatase family metal-dependent hydrolase
MKTYLISRQQALFIALFINLTASFALAQQSVTGFSLINADNDQTISVGGSSSIPDGAVIYLEDLPTRNLSVRVNTDPPTVGSVKINHNGAPRTDNSSPYSLNGDSGGDFAADPDLVAGTQSLVATPYTKPNGKGSAGNSSSITFYLRNRSAPTPTPTPISTPTPSTESADGTRCPPASGIIDDSGAVWTIGAGSTILRNGSQIGGGYGFEILWYQRAIYVLGTDYNWYRWIDNAWSNIGPRDPSSSNPTPTPTPAGPTPYTTINVPGRVQAEYFDNGGQNVAYYDDSSGNSGDYTGRVGDVDLENSSDGTPNIGWIGDGEWLHYTVNVTASGTYDFKFSLSSYNTGLLDVYVDGNLVIDDLATPNTGSWQSYTNTVRGGINLSTGQHRIKVVAVQGPFNFNHLDIALPGPAPTPTPAPTPSPTPTGGSTLKVMTWNVQFHERAGIDAQVNLVVEKNPDIVLLQEGSEAALFRDLMQSRTGVTWYHANSCEGAAVACGGVDIISRLPFSAKNTVNLGYSNWGAYRHAVRVEVTVGTRKVNIINAHLDWYYGDGALWENATKLMSWQTSFGGPKIIGGDFNSWFKGTSTQLAVLDLIRNTHGFTDTCIEKYGTDEELIPHTNFFDGGSWRPDAIYRSSGIVMEALDIDDRGTWYSDHKPIFVRFRIQ